MDNKHIRPGGFQKSMGVFTQAGTVGLHMVSGPAVGFGVGWLLDDWLGSDPWMKAAFFLVGIVAGFRAVYEDARKITGETREKA